MTKKTLIMLLCAVVTVTAAAVGTIAYLTDAASVTNTFTVGNVSIKLEETDVNPNGQPIDAAGNVTQNPVRKEEGNSYHLLPGQTYVKDPTLTVLKGSEECYVRLLVTITHVDKLRGVLGANFLPQHYVTGWNANVWPCVGVTEGVEKLNPGTPQEVSVPVAVYEFRYHKPVNAKDTEDVMLEPLFTSFKVPGELSAAQLAQIAQMETRVEGYAIQTAGFPTADEAWTAFGRQVAP